MHGNHGFAAVLLAVAGLACASCTANYPVRIDADQAEAAQPDDVVFLSDLRQGDALTATMQSGAVKHFRLASFDEQTLYGKHLVLGIDGVERLEVRRNNVLRAAGTVTSILTESLLRGAADGYANRHPPHVDHP